MLIWKKVNLITEKLFKRTRNRFFPRFFQFVMFDQIQSVENPRKIFSNISGMISSKGNIFGIGFFINFINFSRTHFISVMTTMNISEIHRPLLLTVNSL